MFITAFSRVIRRHAREFRGCRVNDGDHLGCGGAVTTSVCCRECALHDVVPGASTRQRHQGFFNRDIAAVVRGSGSIHGVLVAAFSGVICRDCQFRSDVVADGDCLRGRGFIVAVVSGNPRPDDLVRIGAALAHDFYRFLHIHRFISQVRDHRVIIDHISDAGDRVVCRNTHKHGLNVVNQCDDDFSHGHVATVVPHRHGAEIGGGFTIEFWVRLVGTSA